MFPIRFGKVLRLSSSRVGVHAGGGMLFTGDDVGGVALLSSNVGAQTWAVPLLKLRKDSNVVSCCDSAPEAAKGSDVQLGELTVNALRALVAS